jgi:hypothetical protein
MTEENIISSHIVAGRRKTPVVVALIETAPHTSTDAVLTDAAQQGTDLGAEWIVGFNFQSTPANNRVGRKWKGFGTAIRFK